jgi:hypothetical protein
MSIFREMYELRTFQSPADYADVLRMLSQAMERGWVEEVPVTIKRPVAWDERWFREKDTGEVYLLEVPNPPSTGSWRPVEPEELFPGVVVASSNPTPN